MKHRIIKTINESISLKQALLGNSTLLQNIEEVIGQMVNAIKHDKQVYFCGNGGSAADAQHLAAELLGRFYLERKPYGCEALHTNTSYLTAISNDYSFQEVYARLLKAKGKQGDILVALSTSGNSENILQAIETANQIGLVTIGLTGNNGGKMRNKCSYLINVPSNDTPRIQELHIMIGHIICEHIEKLMTE